MGGPCASRQAPLEGMAHMDVTHRHAAKVCVCCAAEDFKDRAVEQIAEWLSLSAAAREDWMDARVEEFPLEDLAHPAFARFKAVFEELDIRKSERGMRFCQVCAPAWQCSRRLHRRAGESAPRRC